MEPSAARKVHDFLGLAGFRSLTTAAGFFQLARELKAAGNLDDDAIERISDAMLSELLENLPRSLIGNTGHGEHLRQRLRELFAGTQPLTASLSQAEHGGLMDSHCAPLMSGMTEHIMRSPCADDAKSVLALVGASPPLDPNSLYCNLLQCTHFAATCLVAERGGKIEGWVSGYRPPEEHDALFVWQVAIDEGARGLGLGLGTTLLDALLRRPATTDATRMITTVTPSNIASRRMFARLARLHDADIWAQPWFDGAHHFGGGHESEELITIGPLKARPI